MSRIAYVNGRYIAHQTARVHVEDRGYQFADGVYEVWSVRGGVLQDHASHMDRLQRSLRELGIPFVHSVGSLNILLYEVLRRNQIVEGIVYLQITRGVTSRDHAWPANLLPSLIITAKTINPIIAEAQAKIGVSIITTPDLRWKRCDIKSISLLPNVLAKQLAISAGCTEAWLVDEEGFVTEGTSTNAWIVTHDDVLVTRDLSHQILSGVTRLALLDLATQHQLKTVQRKFTVEEACQAKEAFISAATTWVLPVVAIDGTKIGTGKPGPLGTLLRQAYLAASTSVR